MKAFDVSKLLSEGGMRHNVQVAVDHEPYCAFVVFLGPGLERPPDLVVVDDVSLVGTASPYALFEECFERLGACHG